MLVAKEEANAAKAIKVQQQVKQIEWRPRQKSLSNGCWRPIAVTARAN
jgi:hypothetical protein